VLFSNIDVAGATYELLQLMTQMTAKIKPIVKAHRITQQRLHPSAKARLGASYSSNIQPTVTATATPREIIPIFTKNKGAFSGSVMISRMLMASRQALVVHRCCAVVLR
jgi:cell division GTPase FtsZ